MTTIPPSRSNSPEILRHEFLKQVDRLSTATIDPFVEESVATITIQGNAWQPPPFCDKPSTSGHIFRKDIGHLEKDTPQNRKLIFQAVADPSNKVGVNKYGVEIYKKILPNGTQVWAHVRNGEITNGGLNLQPQRWIPDPGKRDGGYYVPYIHNVEVLGRDNFSDRVQYNGLARTYNVSCSRFQMPIHSCEKVGTSNPSASKLSDIDPKEEKVKGILHETGLILDLLEELKAQESGEHMFFIPTPDKEGSLTQEEFLEILTVVARGVYIYETVPFVSLHFNPKGQLYPVIHPVYQNTFVGYAIATLDYYMKAFGHRKFYAERFTQEWHNNPSTDRQFLEAHCIDFKAYCQQNLDVAPLTLNEFIERQNQEKGQNSILKDADLTAAFQIVGKQKSIRRSENLFIPDGDFSVEYALTDASLGDDELRKAALKLGTATEQMCKQIETILPQVPIAKKLVTALYVMNFFSYYFKTLKEANKVPIFQNLQPQQPSKVCPTLFPPVPQSKEKRAEFKVSTLFKELSGEEFTLLEGYLKQRKVSSTEEKALQLLTSTFEKYVQRERPSVELTHEDCRAFAELLWKNCVGRFEANQNATNTALIQMGIKKRLDWKPGEKEATLLKSIEANLKELDRNITKTGELIATKQKKKQSHTQEFEWLCEYSKAKEEIVKQQKLFQRWVQNPLEAISAGLVLSLDSVTRKLNMLTDEADGKIELVGGCTLETKDLVSTPDALADTLLDRYGEALSAVPYETMAGTGPADPSPGVFFKLAFDELHVFGGDKEQSSIRYLYPNTLDETTLPMFHALATQDKALFAETVPKMTNWNAKDSLGVSLIHYAALAQDPFFLRELIRHNADLYAVDEQGFTAMHYATRDGVISSIQLLAHSAPSLLTIQSQAGETPLYIASQNNRLQAVRFFIENKIDLTTPAKHGMNALLCALHHGFEDIALELLGTHTFDLDYPTHGKAAVHSAIEMRLERALVELVRQGANVNKTIRRRWRPIDIAIAADWLQGVKILTSVQNIKLDHLKIALVRQTEIAKYLTRVVSSQTGQLVQDPTTNPQKAWEDINWAYNQAAYIRNNLEDPAIDVSAAFTELNLRIAQIGESLLDDSVQPEIKQSYKSLKFQVEMLTSLVISKRIKLGRGII